MAANPSSIAALVAQLPDVDPPPPPRKPRPANSEAAVPAPATKPEPPPDPNRPGKFTGPDHHAAEKLFDDVFSRGARGMEELVRLIRAPGDPEFTNYKAAYLLHGLAIYAGVPSRQHHRRALAKTISDHLARDYHSKKAKAFLIQELQTIGGTEAVRALGKQLTDDELCEPAARALLSIREGAAKQIRLALPKLNSRNRLHLIQALGLLRDANSVRTLIRILSDADNDVRISAASALAKIGHPSAVDPVMRYADRTDSWERIQANDACVILAQNLRMAGKNSDASRIYLHLRSTRGDRSESHIRQLAEKALRDL